jgi:hypothetical protein
MFHQVQHYTAELMKQYDLNIETVQRCKNQTEEVNKWNQWVQDHYFAIMAKLKDQAQNVEKH